MTKRRVPFQRFDRLVYRHELVDFAEMVKQGIEEVLDKRFGEFEQKIDAKMDQRFGDMQQQMDQRFNRVDHELASLQQQVHQVSGEQQSDIKAILHLLETQYVKKPAPRR